MELLKGEDMSEMRHRQSTPSRIPLAIAVHLTQEMIRLLQKLHALGYIHRDIKPKYVTQANLRLSVCSDLYLVVAMPHCLSCHFIPPFYLVILCGRVVKIKTFG